MPAFVVKPDPAVDFYVYWSTVVESPLAWGSIAELEADWPDLTGHGPFDPERFARAGRTGSSAHCLNFGYPYGSEGMIYEQQGWLPRANLPELCHRLEVGAPVDDLLEPFEDDQTPTESET